MNKEQEKAQALFDQGYSCSQAVFAAMCKQYYISEDEGLRIAAAFGGGIAGKELTCGAVTGAYMALGLKFGSNKHEVYEKTRTFDAQFLKQFGSLNCGTILEGKEKGSKLCSDCVCNAIKLVQSIE